MSLSSCEKCWDTPCECGHEWRKNYSPSRLHKHMKMIAGVLAEKEKRKVYNESEFTAMIRDPNGEVEPEYDVGFNQPFYKIETPDGNNVCLTIEAVIEMGKKAEDFRAKYGVPKIQH